MTRRTQILMLIVSVELVAIALYAAIRAGGAARSGFRLPQIDTTALHPVDAEEIDAKARSTVVDDPTSLLELAQILTVYGFFPESEVICAEAARLQPDSFDAHLWWGIALDRLGKMERAIDRFQQAAELGTQEKAAKCRYYIGRNFLRLERPKQAEQAFREAASYPPARYELAKLLVRTDRIADGIKVLDQLLTQFPNDHVVLQLKGRALLADGDVQAATSLFELAERSRLTLPLNGLTLQLIQRKRSTGVSALLASANDDARENRHSQAIDKLTRVLDLGWSPDAAYLLASILAQRGRLDEAARHINALLQQEGSDTHAVMLAARIALLQKDGELAMRHLSGIGPEMVSPGIHQGLSAYYKERNNDEAAKRHAAWADEVAGVDAFRKNDLKTAESRLQRAAEASPGRSRVWFYLAETQRFLGNPAAAKRSYKQCLSLDPDFERARVGMKRLESTKTSR